MRVSKAPSVDFNWVRKWSFTSLLVLLGLKSVDAQTQKVPKEELVLNEPNEMINPQDSTRQFFVFRGTVVDSVKREALYTAVVIGLDSMVGGAITQPDGSFVLKVDKQKWSKDSIVVELAYIGYHKQIITLHSHRNDTISLVPKTGKQIEIPIGFRVEPTPRFNLKPIRPIKSWIRKD